MDPRERRRESSRRLSQTQDEYLVLLAQSGSTSALERLIHRWQPKLWRHARRLLASPDAAGDALQEAWIAIVAGLRRLDEPKRFGPWAYRIVTNKAADWARREGARAAATERAGEAQSADLPEEEASEVGALRKAIARLSADRRALLSLYYTEGLTVGEIAVALGVPEGTVKSRLHNVRRELQEMLKRRETGRFLRSRVT